MLKKLLTTCAFVGVLVHSSPSIPAQAVIDGRNLAEAQRQLTEMRRQYEELQKQFSELQKHTQLIEDTVSAIGAASQIRLPMLNLQKLKSQLESDIQCLIPDLGGIFPSISFEDVDIGSLCGRREAYKEIMWAPVEHRNPDGSPVEGGDLGSIYGARLEALGTLEERRRDFGVEASSSALATADGAQEAIQEHTESLSDLYIALETGEKDANDRLDLAVRAMIINGQATAKNTQVMAELLRLQSAWYIIATGRVGQTALEEE